METNATSVSPCGRESEIVAYLYSESSIAEREGFESHLLECMPCTDEFAQISEARFSVYEWQREEFEPLATPRFVIPYPEPAASALTALIRGFLGIATPGFAAAAVIISLLLGIGVWVYRLAETNVEQTASAAREVPILDAVPEANSGNASGETSAVSADNESFTAVAANRGQVALVKRADTKSRHSTLKARMRPKTLVDRDQTVAVAQKSDKPLPSLTGEADDEDDSLRLADLLEVVGNNL